MHRIDRDVSDTQAFVKISIGGNVAAAVLDAHFNLKASAFAHGSDVDFLVQDLEIGVVFDVRGGVDAGLCPLQVNRLWFFAVQLQWNLLQVQYDVGGIFDHTWDGRKFVQHTFDFHRSERSALNGREQNAAERIADGGAEAAFKGLC